MSKTILIIEDDANLLYSLQAKFRIENFKVEVGHANDNFQEVLNQIKTVKPDFIILDLVLPRVDGFEIVRELKSNKETSVIPIFVFTNLSDQDSKARGLNLGVDYYLVKTDFSIDEFVSKVKKIIENKEKLGSR